MERKEAVMEAAQRMFPGQFEKSSRETVLFCEDESSRITDSFLNAFMDVIRQAVGRNQENDSENVEYLLFSCLHSSIFLRKYLIRVDLMGAGLYSEEPMGTTYWDAGDIYRLFERDIEEIRRKVTGAVPRLREYETDDIRYAYAPYYHSLAREFIKEMTGAMLEGAKEQQEKETGKKVKILFGEYMGEADILFETEWKVLYEVFRNIYG